MYNDRLRQLQRDPIAMGRDAGFDIPDGITEPRAIVTHLIDSGQVKGQALQMIMPMLRQLGWK